MSAPASGEKTGSFLVRVLRVERLNAAVNCEDVVGDSLSLIACTGTLRRCTRLVLGMESIEGAEELEFPWNAQLNPADVTLQLSIVRGGIWSSGGDRISTGVFDLAPERWYDSDPLVVDLDTGCRVHLYLRRVLFSPTDDRCPVRVRILKVVMDEQYSDVGIVGVYLSNGGLQHKAWRPLRDASNSVWNDIFVLRQFSSKKIEIGVMVRMLDSEAEVLVGFEITDLSALMLFVPEQVVLQPGGVAEVFVEFEKIEDVQNSRSGTSLDASDQPMPSGTHSLLDKITAKREAERAERAERAALMLSEPIAGGAEIDSAPAPPACSPSFDGCERQREPMHAQMRNEVTSRGGLHRDAIEGPPAFSTRSLVPFPSAATAASESSRIPNLGGVSRLALRIIDGQLEALNPFVCAYIQGQNRKTSVKQAQSSSVWKWNEELVFTIDLPLVEPLHVEVRDRMNAPASPGAFGVERCAKLPHLEGKCLGQSTMDLRDLRLGASQKATLVLGPAYATLDVEVCLLRSLEDPRPWDQAMSGE
eukprot:NODE_270_length_2561_cov_24.178344_g248_i0.p1 GENE.NODE_270_length_2561_cov_24.178344_g248_i0~~NODE_270_length_2561_cov_24.178344_g248_i0.p1  ORF type:complete len:532 (-),score=88.60 NODE_270_length_2561_cov_24.178344_g248_i0:849-2444(-)